jgi:predicted kinase
VILCEVPREELRRRALARERSPHRISDATAEVALALADSFEAPDELDPGVVCRIRTDAPQPVVLERVASWLDEQLPPL